MPEAELIVKFLFFSVLAGWIGTAGLTGFLLLLTRAKVTNANMVVALGSLLTHSRERAVEVGVIIHIISGTIFGVLYTCILMAIGDSGVGTKLLFGLLIGVLHGVAVAICLVATVADCHPLEEFRGIGFGVGLAHWIGHVIYGGLVGLVIGVSGLIN